MRGRKPLPPHLALVLGAKSSKQKRKKAQLVLPTTMPTPPSFLDADGKREWRRLGPRLHALGLLTPLDVMSFGAYCDSISLWRRATRLLAKLEEPDDTLATVTGGLLRRAGNSTPIPSPLLAIANRARADIVRYGAEFGLSPSARTRLDLTKVPHIADDPAERFFRDDDDAS